MFLTSPNYFGIVGDIAGIIELAHARGIPVVVDAAHAPHFHFCAALPVGAEDLGADLVAQSTHKVATALSQGSLLLLNNPVFIDALYEHVNDLGFVSTSFSYPILASLELGVQQLVEEGEEIWRRTVERAERFRRDLAVLSNITCFGRERVSSPGFHDLDSTRITLDVSRTGLTGFDVERQLNREWIYPEMATLRHLLFLLTPGTTEGDLERLFASLARIDRAGDTRPPRSFPLPPPVPPMAVIPRTAKYSQKRAVPLRDAVGRVSGETISAYPPGRAGHRRWGDRVDGGDRVPALPESTAAPRSEARLMSISKRCEFCRPDLTVDHIKDCSHVPGTMPSPLGSAAIASRTRDVLTDDRPRRAGADRCRRSRRIQQHASHSQSCLS